MISERSSGSLPRRTINSPMTQATKAPPATRAMTLVNVERREIPYSIAPTAVIRWRWWREVCRSIEIRLFRATEICAACRLVGHASYPSDTERIPAGRDTQRQARCPIMPMNVQLQPMTHTVQSMDLDLVRQGQDGRDVFLWE